MNSLATTLQQQINNFEKEGKKLTIKLVISSYSNQYQKFFSKKLSLLALKSEISLKDTYFERKLYSADNVKSEFNLIKRLMKNIIHLTSRLEEHKYLGNPELKLRISSYLTCIYDVEIELKQRVFKGLGHPTNPDIINFLVSLSMEAIANRLDALKQHR